MRKLLRKEIRLSASVLSFLFIVSGFMALLPGYPVLCGAFFITLGIFQSFQRARETNDTVFTVLLPVAKRDAVKAKYLFCTLIELCGFVPMVLCTLLRMTALRDAAVYRGNALMNANPFFLGTALFIFGLFNAIFVGGFYRTAYSFTKPFILYVVAAFLTIGAAETLHHIPGLGGLNAFGFDCLPLQLSLLGAGAAVFALLTTVSCRVAGNRFEKIDL